jgi:hypothetical protein
VGPTFHVLIRSSGQTPDAVAILQDLQLTVSFFFNESAKYCSADIAIDIAVLAV